MEVSNELFSDQFPINEYAAGDYQITVWPNPVSTILNVKIESETEEEITVELLDVLGRSTLSKTNHLPYGLFEMDFTDKTPGMYLLRFLDKDGALIKTILNVKN